MNLIIVATLFLSVLFLVNVNYGESAPSDKSTQEIMKGMTGKQISDAILKFFNIDKENVSNTTGQLGAKKVSKTIGQLGTSAKKATK